MAKEMTGTGLNEVETKITEMIFDLNEGTTPAAIKRKVGRALTRGEIGIVLNAFQVLVPKTKWLKVWRAQEDENAWRGRARRAA